MICPFRPHINNWVKQYDYDEDGRLKHEALVEMIKEPECLREGCGAWRDGRCIHTIKEVSNNG